MADYNKTFDIIKKIINIGIYLGFFLVMFVCIYEKKNYHTDEISTYVLSNNTFDDSITVNPEMLYKYDEPEQIWLRSMTVQKGEQFNYKNVWQKQESDVHPPMYYVMIHTISSFVPGVYSKWIAGSVNILFALLTLFYIRKITRKLCDNDVAVFFVSCCFVLSAGVLSATTFFRMYIMTMFWVALVSYLFMKGLSERNVRFYLGLYVVSVLGVLTHYYFVVYLFFICLTFGIYMLVKKQWKDVGIFIATMIFAGLSALAIFPSIIDHTLGGGYRGEETINNFAQNSFTEFWARLCLCYEVVDSQLFGGLFGWYIVAAIIMTVVSFIFKKKIKFSYEWLLLSVPTVFYFIFVSKVTIFCTDRYFHPIYPILFVLLVSWLCVCVEKIVSKKIAFCILAGMLLVSTGKEFKDNWFYLYRSTQPFINAAASHSNTDCIYVVNAGYEINPSFNEIRNYDTVTFVPKEMLEEIDNMILDTDNGLVISMGTACDFDMIRDKVQEVWPELDAYYELGTHSFSVSYYFYSSN